MRDAQRWEYMRLGADSQGEAHVDLASSDAFWLAREAPMGFKLRSWNTRSRRGEPSVHATSRAHDRKAPASQNRRAGMDDARSEELPD
jgi:hypothetical protein